jgi:hypothetical protein
MAVAVGKKRRRKSKRQFSKLQKLGWFLNNLLYRITRGLKVIVLVGLVNALFTYCFWSLSNRVTELEQTSQETLILTEKIMEEMSK